MTSTSPTQELAINEADLFARAFCGYGSSQVTLPQAAKSEMHPNELPDHSIRRTRIYIHLLRCFQLNNVLRCILFAWGPNLRIDTLHGILVQNMPPRIPETRRSPCSPCHICQVMGSATSEGCPHPFTMNPEQDACSPHSSSRLNVLKRVHMNVSYTMLCVEVMHHSLHCINPCQAPLGDCAFNHLGEYVTGRSSSLAAIMKSGSDNPPTA